MNDDRAAEGLDHLQAAALELIEAARAFLDVAEEMVRDRERVGEVLTALGTVADVANRAARARGDHARDPGRRPSGDTGEDEGGHDRAAPEGRVRPIRVSS